MFNNNGQMSGMNHGGNRSSIRVAKFLIAETGTYNMQYRRPYETEMNAGTFNDIANRLGNTNHINPTLLGGLVDRFIVPSAQPEKQIMIPNGWTERRLRFQMEVETTFAQGGSITEIIQGYTDFVGVSNSGHISPDMEFHINSVLKVRKQVENTPFGVKSYFNVVDSSHVLVNNEQASGIFTSTEERMRPEDIYSAMTRNVYSGQGSYVDQRTAHNATPVFSSRKNGIPTNYMSEIMTGYQNAIMTPMSDFQKPDGAIMNEARGYTAAPSINQDAFIKAISSLRGVPSVSFFSYGDLVKLDPNAPNMTKVMRVGPATINTNHQAGQTCDWGGSDGATLAATILGTSVPALLMDLALTGIHFRSTNRDIGGQINTVIMDSQGFTDFDITQHLMSFKARLCQEVLQGISHCNMMDFAIEMKVDLLGETFIRVSINGSPFVDYVQPSFADALAVPVLTCNRERVEGVSNDIETFLSSVINTENFAQKPDVQYVI